MKLEKIAEVIEEKSPLYLQESWDNSGFQIKLGNPDISRTLVSLEITDSIISEAREIGAKLIVCHHPMFFTPVRQIDETQVTGNYICRLIEERISVYASHTPFDKCAGGNNDYLAGLLHLKDVGPLPGEDTGICRMGTVDGDCTLGEYVCQTAEWLHQDVRMYRLTGDPMDKVQQVALCSGAGAEYMETACEAGCDLFITGDVKYHTAQKAREMGMNLLDIGHFGSEIIFTANMADWLRKNTDLMIMEAKSDSNPFTVIEN